MNSTKKFFCQPSIMTFKRSSISLADAASFFASVVLLEHLLNLEEAEQYFCEDPSPITLMT
jgi:hypothetical protein